MPIIKAIQATITDNCRRGKGDSTTIDEALEVLGREAEKLLGLHEVGKGVKIHFVLSIEREIERRQ